LNSPYNLILWLIVLRIVFRKFFKRQEDDLLLFGFIVSYTLVMGWLKFAGLY